MDYLYSVYNYFYGGEIPPREELKRKKHPELLNDLANFDPKKLKRIQNDDVNVFANTLVNNELQMILNKKFKTLRGEL